MVYRGMDRAALDAAYNNSIDIGQGVVVRYDEAKREVVGLTILGVRQRVAESLGARPATAVVAGSARKRCQGRSTAPIPPRQGQGR